MWWGARNSGRRDGEKASATRSTLLKRQCQVWWSSRRRLTSQTSWELRMSLYMYEKNTDDNGNEQEAKHKEVHQIAALTAVASNGKGPQMPELRSYHQDNGLTEAVALLVKVMTRERFLQNGETASVLKQRKDGTSADSTALEKKGLDLKTNHKALTKIETEMILVLIKVTVGVLKLEESMKEVAQSRLTRPLPWRDKHDRIQSQVRVKMRQRRVNVVAHSLVLGVQGYDPKRGDEFYGPFHFLERVGTVQNTISKALRNWYRWRQLFYWRNRKYVCHSMMITAKEVDKRIRSVVVSNTLTDMWRTTLTSCQRRKHKSTWANCQDQSGWSLGIWYQGVSWRWRLVKRCMSLLLVRDRVRVPYQGR